MKSDISHLEFRDLKNGDRFYFISELLLHKVDLCTKTDLHSYTDSAGVAHKCWMTNRHVYGPMRKVSS